MGSPPRGQVEQFPITVPFQELIESLHETGHRNRVVLGDVLQVGAHEDQAAGAALAVGGADPGLGVPDLFLQVGALVSLGILKLFFLRF